MPLDMKDRELLERVAARVRSDVDAPRVVAAYRDAYPNARPWDLYILICTDHPRGMYARELAKRKTAQGGSPAWLYRFDWDIDVSEHLKSGNNDITLRIHNTHHNGGLFRRPFLYKPAEK